jgi:hypothetical protein
MAANAKAVIISLGLVLGGLIMGSPQASAASTNVQVHVCAEPSVSLITHPANNSHTTLSSTLISGKPLSGVQVRVTNNGHTYPLSSQPLSVLFTDRVPLQVGRNAIVVTASNACSQTRTTSFIIYRTTPSSSIVWGVLCLILLLIIILLIFLLLACRRRKRGGEDDIQSTP